MLMTADVPAAVAIAVCCDVRRAELYFRFDAICVLKREVLKARPAYERDEIADTLSAFICVGRKPRLTVLLLDTHRLLRGTVQSETF